METTLAFSKKESKKVKDDCDKLYNVLKTCRDEDFIESNFIILNRIIFLIGTRHMRTKDPSNNATVAYLCHHQILPIILLEIVKDSKNLDICAYALEILAKLIIKNSNVAESDRKTIRRLFYDPLHFKLLLDTWQLLSTAVQINQNEENSLTTDLQIRLLKVINCVYMRKGQSQISLISDEIVSFLVDYFTKSKASNDILKAMMPLLKVLCRNKKNCFTICKQRFLNALFSAVPNSNRYPTVISILRLLSKSPEAASEMSRFEHNFHFVINTATNHTDKSQGKKYLMGTLCRITKSPLGAINIAKNNVWLALLEFFRKNDRMDESRRRIALTIAYTILHRGVKHAVINIKPLKLGINYDNDVMVHMKEQRDNYKCDDSDNEESDEEDERKNREGSVIALETEEEDDDDSSDNSSEAYDCDDDDQEIEKSDQNNSKQLESIGDYFLELHSEREREKSKKLKTLIGLRPDAGAINLVEANIKRFETFNRQAFPDALLAESDQSDNSIMGPEVNFFKTEEMAERIAALKGFNQSKFPKKVVYDLDNLINENNNSFDIPDRYTKFRKFSCEKIHGQEVPVLRFESRFECGNLRRVEQIGDYEYNLFISPDINMTSGLQWFYFQISNMLPGKTYVFNIVNFQKVYSQFNYGLQPVLFSVINYTLHSIGWKKMGDKVMYFGNEYVNGNNDKQFRTLRFSVVFPHENDYCYLAYHFPYTYTRLMNTLLSIQALYENRENFYCRIDKLTDTVNGFNEVPLVTITNLKENSGKLSDIKTRPLVFLTARVHPGESNASWIMDGILRYLSSNDESAIKARDGYIFKIIPMLNPEGVIYGNSRCCLTGSDLNRCWKKPHPVLHPEIYYAKRLVEFARDRLENPLFTFIDIHGHSRKKYFFFYGCNPKQSWKEDDKCVDADSADTSYTLMPKALAFDNNMKINFCRYAIERKRETTCRVVMWREFGIKHSYTLECSFCSGENKKKITTQILQNIGCNLIIALANLHKNSVDN